MAFDILEFNKLPEFLRKKILSSRSKSKALSEKVEDSIRSVSMNSSITPPKYRSVRACDRACEGARAGAADAPPLTNRGGNEQDGQTISVASAIAVQNEVENLGDALPSFYASEYLRVVPVGSGNRVDFIRIPKRDKGYSDKHAFVDYVTFGWRVSDYPLSTKSGHQAISDYDYVQCLSSVLFDVFGFGVIGQRENGMNFYKFSFDLGHFGWGIVCIGGQRDTISIQVKGQGLLAAKNGWESRLFQLLTSISSARISRVDLANDNFNSSVSLDDYLQMYKAGLFSNSRRPPEVEQSGNWVNPSGKGRTLYVGSRTSGKLLRIYEKGLQIGNGFETKFPNWVRVELELKSQDRIIPFGVLLHPGQYLAGAYPALANINVVQEKVETFKRQAEVTIDSALETTRVQFGRYIWALSEYYGKDRFFDLVTFDRECLPKRMQSVLNFEVELPETDFIHADGNLVFDEGFVPYINENSQEYLNKEYIN